MTFASLGLDPELVRALDEQGYHEPTPIQLEAIPEGLKGRNVVGSAQTGTGKTAAFLLPILQRLNTGRARGFRALVLVPTRELAEQVLGRARAYGRYGKVRAVAVYGGVGMEPQTRALRTGVDIVIATPGRLRDHIDRGHVDFSKVEVLVLDEADRMLDMGFIRDIRKIMKALPGTRQNLLFSATFSTEIRRLAADLLNSPTEIQIAVHGKPADGIHQVVYPVDKRRKRELLSHKIGAENWRQVLVFTRTKHGANRLTSQLESDGLNAVAIHGNKSQAARLRALSDFKSGKVRVLVATDVAARGLDIARLPHVVNYELPHVPEDYVHRIGRTARAGLKGNAISLVCVDEHRLLADVEKLLQTNIPKEIIPGYEPDSRIKAEPVSKGRAARPSGKGKPRRKQHHSATHRKKGSGQRRTAAR